MKQRLINSLQNREPFILAVMAFLVYGIHTLWTGLYWDDWPFLWLTQVLDTHEVLAIETQRPLSGLFFIVHSALFGTNLLAWQLFNLILRWLSAYSFWWAFHQLWPKRSNELMVAALLFLAYPGFTQQYIAINISRHLLPLALVLLSLGFHVRALTNKSPKWRDYAISIILSAMSLWLTEYYLGLELLRPLFIWALISRNSSSSKQRFKQFIAAWLPFIFITGAYLGWRINLSKSMSYQISFFERLLNVPLETLTNTITIIASDIFEILITVWSVVFDFSSTANFGIIPLIYQLMTIVVIGAVTYIIFKFVRKQSKEPSSNTTAWGWKAITFGLISLFLSGWPIWVVDALEIQIIFPGDRFILPMLTGISLILGGVIVVLLKNHSLQIISVAVLVGFAAGFHFQNGLDYRRDWDRQKEFLWQLQWRIPDIQENTLLLSDELESRSDDKSLSAAINWIYFNKDQNTNLAGWLAYIHLRQEVGELSLLKGAYYNQSYRGLDFRGSTDQVIVVLHNPPSCLRVLNPFFDILDPTLSTDTKNALHLSNPAWIVTSSEGDYSMPDSILGQQPQANWCYYYQKAELARQEEDWIEVSRLADLAIGLEDFDHHPAEMVPFIMGYAHISRVDTAVTLTMRAYTSNENFAPLLCEVWEFISAEVQLSNESFDAVQELERNLTCSQW